MGDAKALQIYLQLIESTLNVCLQVDARRSLYFYPKIDRTIATQRKQSFEVHLQKGQGLGQKISHAFQEAFQRSDQVVIIGTDCPYLTSNIINQTFTELDNQNDLVIGPAEDGGYYLLGSNHFYPDLFKNITWSTEKVFEQTMTIAHDLDLRTKKLQRLSDIDFEADWKAYLASLDREKSSHS